MPSFLMPVLLKIVIPVFAPFVVVGVRKAFEYLDKTLPTPLQPPLAAAVGALAAMLGGVTDCSPEIPAWACGAVLGLAGVGVREAYDQTKKYLEGVR